MSSSIYFRQLFEPRSSTYTYLLACPETKEAILIDPVVDTAERDAELINDVGLQLKYACNTHCHADHITGTAKLKQLFPDCKSQIAAASGAKADITFVDGDRIQFGNRYVTVISTPGHTDGCVCFLLDDSSLVMTGDALLIRGCGRTDFQAGNSEGLYDNIHSKIFTLPDNCLVYPGHDYKGRTCSCISEEKSRNPRLTKSKAEFVDIMQNLGLAYPKQIDQALPYNLRDGEEEA